MRRSAEALFEDEGLRLDAFLAKGSLAPSRSFGARMIDEGRVTVNGRPGKASTKLKAGDIIEVEVNDKPSSAGIAAEEIALKAVYEDAHIIVIDKPKGLAVHPGAGRSSGTLVNALLGRQGPLSSIGGQERPGIVHRLDKDTSGLMVVAKDDLSHIRLSADLAARKVIRTYLAIVRGSFAEQSGRIEAPIGRSPSDRKKMAARPDGRPAVTYFEVEERFKGYTLLKLKLGTGRTHQIRVHMSYIGHPVAGDADYGGKSGELGLKSQALHAAALEFDHPLTGGRMSFSSKPGDEFSRALSMLRGEVLKA